MKSTILESALGLQLKLLSFEPGFLNEVNSVEREITPKNICTFYFIEYIKSSQGGDGDFENKANDYLRDLAEKYVDVFGNLIQKQIEKYINRGRTDPGASLAGVTKLSMARRAPKLADLMKKTYRSDMSRRNDRWNDLADYVVKLSKTSDVKQIIYLIDRINNTVHNTKTQILDKLPNAYELLNAFNLTHEAGVNTPTKNPTKDPHFMEKVDDNIKNATPHGRSSWSRFRD